MRGLAAILAIPALLTLTVAAFPLAACPSAQEPTAGSPDTLLSADSIRISPLEEQVPGLVDDEEADRSELNSDQRERESPERRNRAGRAARWRASLTVRSGAVLQEAAGFARGGYTGDRVKLFQKLTVHGGGWLSAEVLTDKDPGEARAADFVSASVSASLFDGGVRVVAGDYRMRSGQGLLYGGARSIGKGAAVIEPAMRESWGLADGVSSDESRFFRGGAIEARAGPLQVVAFGSGRSATPLLTVDGGVRGIDLSGYHRTGAEIARRGALFERSAGGGLRLRIGDRFSVGGTILATSLRTVSGSGAPGLSGQSGLRLLPWNISVRRTSIDLRAGVGGVTLFGEGIPSGAHTSWIAGVLFAGEASRLVIVRRFYPPADGLHTTSGFADAPGGSNEQGTYAGAEATIVPGVAASAFLDLYSRIIPVQGSFHPPTGVDRLVSLRYESVRRFSAELRFRSTEGEERTADAGGGSLPVPGNDARRVQRVRVESHWNSGPDVDCLFRLDQCVAFPGKGGRESGVMVTAGFALEAGRGMRFDATVRFFRTESYAAGIPAVDVDLPGTIASTVYSGEGSAWSAGWIWRWSARIRFSARYSVLRRDDILRLGTGPAELPSNIREKAGFQLDLSL